MLFMTPSLLPYPRPQCYLKFAPTFSNNVFEYASRCGICLSMPSVLGALTTLGAITVAVFGIFYQLLLKDTLTDAGYWRTSINSLNNAHCTQVPELQACESAFVRKAF